MSYKLLRSGVKRLADNACIPPASDNLDWVEYQKWLAVPNTPQPMDAPTYEEKNSSVLGQIGVLEQKGVRAIRELQIVVGNPAAAKQRVQDNDDAIAALRAQLVP